MSRQAGSIVRGNSKPRRISVKTGRQQVPLCTAHRAKGQGTGNPGVANAFRKRRNWIGQNQGLSWQEWQGSNLRPPVLETGALPIELHSCGVPASPPERSSIVAVTVEFQLSTIPSVVFAQNRSVIVLNLKPQYVGRAGILRVSATR
jgi:hypothetical protein